MAGIHELIFLIFSGAFDNEEAAARTYDLAALKYWGSDSTLNFPVRLSLVVGIWILGLL